MKTRLLILIFLAVSPLAAVAAPVVVGADLPLSGTVAYYGVSARKGIELGLEQIRSSQNLELQVAYEDNQGQAALAATALGKLISVNHAPAVIGGGTSTETKAMAPIANETRTVIISPISSASSITDAGPYVFRTCPSDSAQARDLAQWSASVADTVAVIYVNSTWGTGLKDNLVVALPEFGAKVLNVKSCDPGDLQFRAQLTVLKALPIKALIAVTYAREGAALVRQARELGITVPIFGADPWSQQDFRDLAQANTDGVRYTTPVQDSGETFQQFRAAFVKKYGEEPDVYAANGFDCIKLLARVLGEGAHTGEDIQRRLAKVTDFVGATGVTNFDANGDVIGKHFGRFVIEHGEPHRTN